MDLITLGEVLLRLSVTSPGRMETARQLDVQFGGAEANVAATVARLGLSTAWISAVPANAWGDRVRREMSAHGVDCGYVRRTEGARLGLYFLEYGVPPRPIRVLYDRRASAYASLTVDDVDWEPVRRARLVHLSGASSGLGDSARALVLRAIDEAAMVSFDVNYRAALWTGADARRFIEPILPRVRYLFVGEEEAATVFELTGDPESTLEKLAGWAPKATVALLRGANGSLVREGDRLYAPARRPAVQLVDPIGAGDAYVGGFLWATLRERPIQEAVDTADAVAALKCSMWGDIAIIDPRDVADALAGGPGVRR
ncbi:MAG TPA: sugar kinase [Candidatus Acidoferrum sp.]|nr:sugar kinase [Candidatus Acidoferrum sp.]